MQRRNFITGMAGVAAIVALPIAGSSVDVLAAERRLNTFGPNDTVHQRLEKFNRLTGLGLSLAWIDTDGRYVRTDKFYGERSGGRSCLVFQDGSGTGYMDREAFLQWTAQVALGYRIAKAQEA